MHNSRIEFIVLIIKCFMVLIIFGFMLPKLIDNFLFYLYKGNIYENSIFVNFVVDKNNKFIYNYIYIVKAILHTF